MKTSLFLAQLICFSLILALISATYTGNFSTGTTGQYMHGPYKFNGSAGANTADVQLTFDNLNSVSQILMQVRSSNSTPTSSERKIENYAHKYFNSTGTYDLQNANSGQRQVVNIGGLSTNNTLFIFVINFNALTASNYTITIVERVGYDTSYCSAGNPLAPNSIYCSNCSLNNNSGSFCNISNTALSNNMSYSLGLYAWNDWKGNFGTMTIPASSNQFTLFFTATNTSILNAVQFKNYNSEVAGLMNYASTGGLRTLTQYNTQYSLSVNTGGVYDISVSFLNLNSAPVTINIWYVVQTSSNILVIVLAVLGSILFIGLVVVAVCIIRKMRSSEQSINPLSAMMARANTTRIHNVNDLNAQEIQTYFPSVLCKNVLNVEEHSINNLNTVEKEKEDRDCVICLCPIVDAEMIKVAYCRHLFHANCLTKWFQKQRNCPYCRQQYNKKSTLEHYQSLLGIAHKNILAGIDLAKEILLHRQKSNVVVQQFKE